MALTIALIGVGMLVLAGVELWLFWSLGDRSDRRRQDQRPRASTGAGSRKAS
jgi:hypothetical protein